MIGHVVQRSGVGSDGIRDEGDEGDVVDEGDEGGVVDEGDAVDEVMMALQGSGHGETNSARHLLESRRPLNDPMRDRGISAPVERAHRICR